MEGRQMGMERRDRREGQREGRKQETSGGEEGRKTEPKWREIEKRKC